MLSVITVNIIIFSLLTVYNNYFFFKHKNYYEITSRIYSLFNALVSVIFGSLYLNNFISVNALYYCNIVNTLFILIDYELYLTNKISSKGKNIMLFHHLIFAFGIYYTSTYPYYCCSALLTETSTIFLNFKWFAYYDIINKKNLVIYDFMLWITFLYFRIINLTIVFNELYNDNMPYKNFKIIPPIILISMNYYWFILLTKKLINYYKGNKLL